MSDRGRNIFLGFIIGSSFAGVMSLDPIAQLPSYHDFADQRIFFGVPNFFDVVSNLPFALFGIIGFLFTLKNKQLDAPFSWTVLFAGVTLVGFGSAYYHLNPNNATLVWDRLPMTVGFVGLTIGILSEYVYKKAERWYLIPAVSVGIFSVLFWYITDDLRLYVWIQAVPLLIILTVMALFKNRYTHNRYLFVAVVCYILAKVAEFYDDEIFAFTLEQLSGHTLKHLLAAFGTYYIYLMLKKKREALEL